MAVPAGGKVSTAHLLQPRVEGEVAFVLGRDLKGPGITAADVLRATDVVLPAIEIIDSRVADWKITYADTVADNASSGLFVLGGKPTPLSAVDLELCGMALRKNGEVVSTGARRRLP
jgi:2-keto-4-pentenoate hydratase